MAALFFTNQPGARVVDRKSCPTSHLHRANHRPATEHRRAGRAAGEGKVTGRRLLQAQPSPGCSLARAGPGERWPSSCLATLTQVVSSYIYQRPFAASD